MVKYLQIALFTLSDHLFSLGVAMTRSALRAVPPTLHPSTEVEVEIQKKELCRGKGCMKMLLPSRAWKRCFNFKNVPSFRTKEPVGRFVPDGCMCKECSIKFEEERDHDLIHLSREELEAKYG